MYGTYYVFFHLACCVCEYVGWAGCGLYRIQEAQSQRLSALEVGRHLRSSVRSESLESFSTKFLSCSRGDVESWLGGMWDVGMIRARADVSMRARMSLLQLGTSNIMYVVAM